MKILFVSSAAVPGMGSVHALSWKWLEIISRDHEVLLLTDPDKWTMRSEYPINKNIRVQYVPFKQPKHIHWFFRAYVYQYHAFLYARSLLQTEQFDIIHSYAPDSWRIPSFMGQLKLPSVWGPVGGGEFYPFHLIRHLNFADMSLELIRECSQRIGVYDAILHSTVQKHTLCLAENRQTKELLHRLGAKKVIVESAQLADISGTLNRPAKNGSLKFIYAGSLIYRKGLDIAIKAFDLLIKNGMKNISWDIYGEGPLRVEYGRLIEQLGITEYVHLKGLIHRDQLLHEYTNYDVYLFPSLRDACGTSLIEAMESGLPVICFDNSGPGNVVNAQCGILCQTSGSMDDLIQNIADAISQLVQNHSRLNEMSIHARKRMVEEGYTSNAKREHLKEYYDYAISAFRTIHT